MDIGKSFSFVFQDPKWITKLLIGAVLLLIPIIGWIPVTGYYLTTLKNVSDGKESPLPEWSDFGGFFMKGLYGWIGSIVWYLPAILIACCVGIIGVAGSSVGSAAGRDNSGAITSAVSYLAICLNCLQSLFSFVAGVTLAAPMVRYANTSQLSVFWDIRGNLDFIMKNIGNYLIALLVGYVASFIALFGIILCVIGVLVTFFWAAMVNAFLFGQVWKNRVASAAG
jgi:hypothetical protein